MKVFNGSFTDICLNTDMLRNLYRRYAKIPIFRLQKQEYKTVPKHKLENYEEYKNKKKHMI